jgi:hypothetical protein
VVTIVVTAHGRNITVNVDRTPALGWRFWTFAGFPADPVEPRPYGGSRGLPLCITDTHRGPRWITAMELDGTAQLFAQHELFPCPDQTGVADFGSAWLERHAIQPSLF